MYFDETGLPWVMPSPNMPTLDTAVVYPGTVLFEGTNVSEGRGTTRPFELIGAPWVDADALSPRSSTRYDLPGVHFRPVVFEPTFQKHAKRRVRRLSDSRARSRARSGAVETAVAVLAEIRAQNPAQVRWRQPPYEYEHEKLPFDILVGLEPSCGNRSRPGCRWTTISRSWRGALERSSQETREPFLIY